MGGDRGLYVTVRGALLALKKHKGLSLILVGQRDKIEKELAKIGEPYDKSRLTLHDASQVVLMDEQPSYALRSKKDSSMRVAINLVKEGRAKACVSAGNTGALMATARFVLKTLPGIDRPALINPIPSEKGAIYMLDLGANVDCQADHLLQFAVMGSVLVQAVDDQISPKVGLLNIGSEAIKGSEQVKRAAQLLENAQGINYIGFIEGDDIYKGKADVVVCDGFVGNVALKASEGIAKMLTSHIKQSFLGSWYGRFAAIFAAPILKKIQQHFNPGNYNGASFVGLQGIVVKSHGSADEKAFASAIRVAMLEIENNVPETIKATVSEQLGLCRSA